MHHCSLFELKVEMKSTPEQVNLLLPQDSRLIISFALLRQLLY